MPPKNLEKVTPGRPKSAPRAPGGLLAPSGVDFGPSGAPFSKLPALLAKPSGKQAQAQDGSVGHAKRL